MESSAYSTAATRSRSTPAPTPSTRENWFAISTPSPSSRPELGTLRFTRVQPGWLKADAAVRTVGVEQSNSSIVFGDETVLKVFRKLEPGINPELELLQFLTAHGFDHIAPLQGWYEYEGARSRPRSASRSGSSPTRPAAGSWRWTSCRPTPSRCSASSGASGA